MSKKLPPPNPSSSSSTLQGGGGGVGSTYELQQAQTLASSQSDPISWSSARSYRRRPYRQLHHQRGTIGTYTVRLLECQELERSHWSLLGMGPVRHLGLSRAHGEVSAYVELSLGWSDGSDGAAAASSGGGRGGAGNEGASASGEDALMLSEVNSRESAEGGQQDDADDHDDDDLDDRKPAAAPPPQHQQQQQKLQPDLMSMSLRDAAAQQMQKAARHDDDDIDAKKPAAASSSLPIHDQGPVESMHDLDVADHRSQSQSHNTRRSGASHVQHRSSTVRRNSNPVWPTAQGRDGNRSLFAIRLHKRRHRSSTNHTNDGEDEDGSGHGGGGGNNTDGQRIQLRLVVKEEMTGVENAIPDPFGLGLTKGGGAGSQGGTIGVASVDVTDLALGCVGGEEKGNGDGGEDANTNNGGSGGGGGVIDGWADLTLPIDNSRTGVARSADHPASSTETSDQANAKCTTHKRTGRVRVLVSYEPNGMDPRRGDVAALECFARRNPSKSSCRILIPPLSPLRVLDVVGSHCLVEYDLPSSDMEALTSRDRKKQYASTQNGHRSHSQPDKRDKHGGSNSTRKTGRARIHRNSIFVIERTNAVDGAVNLALAPVDAYLSTPLGRATSQIAGPLLDAAGDLVAPAMLTGRLMMASVNTVGAVGLNSAGAIVSTVARSLDSNSEQKLDDRDPLSKVG